MITISWATAFGAVCAWCVFLLGGLKWLGKRQVAAFDSKLTEVDTRTAATSRTVGELKKALDDTQAAFKQALTESQAAFKQALTESQAAQKQALTESIAALRYEFSQRGLCSQHQRMEENDREVFQTLRQLHGDIREMVGGMTALKNSIELVNQHLLNGGK